VNEYTVFCPPGKATLAHLGCAMAGVRAEVVETPLDEGAFYVVRNYPAPAIEFVMTDPLYRRPAHLTVWSTPPSHLWSSI
jgi:hypothetical protein